MREFPKPYMRQSELEKMGIPRAMLTQAYRDPGQRFASKINPTKSNSPIVFETEGLKKWMELQIKAQLVGMQRK